MKPRAMMWMAAAVLLVAAVPAWAGAAAEDVRGQTEATADDPQAVTADGVAAEGTAEDGEGGADAALPDEQAEPQTFGERLGALWLNLATKWEVGGPTMYALAFVALVAIVFMMDRLVGLRRGRIVPRGLADRANRMWQEGQYAEILAMTRDDRTALGEVIAFLVEHRSNPYENITSGAEDIAARHFEVQERRNYPLAAAGTLAPLLGLMGTIFGLMGAFASIGAYGSMDDPAILAGNIGEAMITTAFGLIIAVPALGLYHYFSSRTGQYAGVLGQEVSELMHNWFLEKEEDDRESAA